MPAFLFSIGTAPAKPAPLSCLPVLLAKGVIGGLLIGTLALGGCATTSPDTNTTAQASSETPADNSAIEAAPDTAAAPVEEPKEPEIEYGNFTEDQLSRLILAELAGQRGQSSQAL